MPLISSHLCEELGGARTLAACGTPSGRQTLGQPCIMPRSSLRRPAAQSRPSSPASAEPSACLPVRACTSFVLERDTGFTQP
eukprot:933839-Alexandrium_andersonii.AAC.1